MKHFGKTFGYCCYVVTGRNNYVTLDIYIYMKYRMRELVLRKGRPDKGFNWGRDFITCVEVDMRAST